MSIEHTSLSSSCIASGYFFSFIQNILQNELYEESRENGEYKGKEEKVVVNKISMKVKMVQMLK